MTPLPRAAFQSRQFVAALNVLAVGTALAAATSAAFGMVSPDARVASAASTLVVGLLWAAALRSPRRVGRRRAGWVASPVLACVNSMLCVGLLSGRDSLLHPVQALLMVLVGGALVGAVVWVPALALTLIFFGWPIAHAQRLAARGLAGADRGEMVVGAMSALVASLALLATPGIHTLLAGLALASGLSAVALSVVRARARAAFVRRVASGEVPQFRVDDAPEGKVLVRVTTTGVAYRVSDFAEEIATLSAEGDVVRYLARD